MISLWVGLLADNCFWLDILPTHTCFTHAAPYDPQLSSDESEFRCFWVADGGARAQCGLPMRLAFDIADLAPVLCDAAWLAEVVRASFYCGGGVFGRIYPGLFRLYWL